MLKVRGCKIAACILGFCLLGIMTILIYEVKREHILQIIMTAVLPAEITVAAKTSRLLTNISSSKIEDLHSIPWTGRSLQGIFDDMKPFTLESDYRMLQHHVVSAGLNFAQMAQLKLTSGLLQVEKELYADPPLMDPLLVPNDTFTKVSVINPRVEYIVGQVLTVRVDVRDGYDQPMRRGRDIVYVWLMDEVKNASMATEVLDLKNGTYLAHFTLRWTGYQKVKVAVRYPREALRTLLYTRHRLKSLRYVAAGYIGPTASETTLCLPFPLIPAMEGHVALQPIGRRCVHRCCKSGLMRKGPDAFSPIRLEGYSKVCNFSPRNHNLSWYCGHPRKPSLSCSDWSILRDLEFPTPLPMTKAEETLMISLITPPVPRLVRRKITLFVATGQHHLPPLCDKNNYTHTWLEPAPRGFFLHGTWIPTTCTLPTSRPELWLGCLKNTRLTLTGDSNLLMWFYHFKARILCRVDY